MRLILLAYKEINSEYDNILVKIVYLFIYLKQNLSLESNLVFISLAAIKD